MTPLKAERDAPRRLHRRLFAMPFLSLVGLRPTLYLVFVLLVVGGMGSDALHLVGTTAGARDDRPQRCARVGFFTAGGPRSRLLRGCDVGRLLAPP
jgi:hypothetical protein